MRERERVSPFCVTSSYKSCTLAHNHIEEPSGHIVVVVAVSLMLAEMSLLLTLYGLLHKQAQILTLRDKRLTSKTKSCTLIKSNANQSQRARPTAQMKPREAYEMQKRFTELSSCLIGQSK